MRGILRSACLAPLLCLLSALAGAAPAQLQPARTELGIKAARISVEVARTPAARIAGLMHRSSLPPQQGMVFVYPASDTRCMWMKNTLIPLSAAFIDAHGRILNIVDMQPGSEAYHCSAAPAQYVLEMNLGWFERNDVASGDTVTGLASLGSAQ